MKSCPLVTTKVPKIGPLSWLAHSLLWLVHSLPQGKQCPDSVKPLFPLRINRGQSIHFLRPSRRHTPSLAPWIFPGSTSAIHSWRLRAHVLLLLVHEDCSNRAAEKSAQAHPSSALQLQGQSYVFIDHGATERRAQGRRTQSGPS